MRMCAYLSPMNISQQLIDEKLFVRNTSQWGAFGSVIVWAKSLFQTN